MKYGCANSKSSFSILMFAASTVMTFRKPSANSTKHKISQLSCLHFLNLRHYFPSACSLGLHDIIISSQTQAPNFLNYTTCVQIHILNIACCSPLPHLKQNNEHKAFATYIKLADPCQNANDTFQTTSFHFKNWSFHVKSNDNWKLPHLRNSCFSLPIRYTRGT